MLYFIGLFVVIILMSLNPVIVFVVLVIMIEIVFRVFHLHPSQGFNIVFNSKYFCFKF
jgi:hypothetical protein